MIGTMIAIFQRHTSRMAKNNRIVVMTMVELTATP